MSASAQVPSSSSNASGPAGVIRTQTYIAFQTYSRHDLESAFSLGMQD